MITAVFVVASQSGTGRRPPQDCLMEVTANIQVGWRTSGVICHRFSWWHHTKKTGGRLRRAPLVPAGTAGTVPAFNEVSNVFFQLQK